MATVTKPLPLPGAKPRRLGSRSEAAAARWGKRLVIATAVIWMAGVAIGFQRSLLVLTLLGFGLAVVGVRNSVLGPFGIVILCTLDPLSRAYLLGGGLWRWNTFNYWLVVVIAISLPFLLRLSHPSIRVLQIFLALLLVELLYSPDRENGIQHVLNLFVFFGLLVYMWRVGTRPEMWFWLACVSGTVAGIGAMEFYVFRSRLPGINENAFSFFPLTAIFVVTLAVPLVEGAVRKKLVLGLGALNAAWVFLSGSRGSTLIAAVCLLFVISHVASGASRLVWIAGVLGVGLVAASLFSEQQARAVGRVSKLLNRSESMRSRTSGRSDLALGGWYIFTDHPLGVGTGGFAPSWARLGDRRGMTNFKQGDPSAAHSGWMKVLAENGVPGILAFAAFVGSFAVVGWQRRSRGVLLVGCMVTVAFGVAFLADEFQGKGLWLLGASAIVVMEVSEQRHRLKLEKRWLQAKRSEGRGRRPALPPGPPAARIGSGQPLLATPEKAPRP